MASPLPLEHNLLSESDAPQSDPRPTLLVVDDEEGPRLSLQVIFQDAFKVLVAEDGPAAVDLARNQRIDVAVLDIRMGGMSGLEVLERLRFIDPDIEAVMMTAFETTDTMRQALRLRACDYINKPFDVATMRASVAKALERRSLGSEIRNNAEKLERLQVELQEVHITGELARTRGEIYDSIIHDINGPLTIISGLMQIIDQRISKEVKLEGEELELVKDRLRRIMRQVTNCVEISRRYLSFLRPRPDDVTSVLVNQILGDVGELLRAHPSTKNNQLVIRPLPEDAAVSMHGTDLIQVLQNLTLNALQCTPQYHQVQIDAHLNAHPLDLGAMQDGPADQFINRENFNNTAPLLAVAVQDNGPGIKPEIMPKIFEPYFTTQPKQQGTGLGLCIVQRLVTKARAGLHVHSQVGQGTVFTLYLPAHPANPSQGVMLNG
jgi:two-component system, sensor histidine kinase and response regulator